MPPIATWKAIIKKEGARFDGVIVAAMSGGRRELMIGAHRDPVFGPVVVVGEGGKYVEAMPDLQLLIPPFTAADVKAALSQLALRGRACGRAWRTADGRRCICRRGRRGRAN